MTLHKPCIWLQFLRRHFPCSCKPTKLKFLINSHGKWSKPQAKYRSPSYLISLILFHGSVYYVYRTSFVCMSRIQTTIIIISLVLIHGPVYYVYGTSFICVSEIQTIVILISLILFMGQCIMFMEQVPPLSYY